MRPHETLQRRFQGRLFRLQLPFGRGCQHLGVFSTSHYGLQHSSARHPHHIGGHGKEATEASLMLAPSRTF
jgi:hypothetical protein